MSILFVLLWSYFNNSYLGQLSQKPRRRLDMRHSSRLQETPLTLCRSDPQRFMSSSWWIEFSKRSADSPEPWMETLVGRQKELPSEDFP